jgi:hypothetical protein
MDNIKKPNNSDPLNVNESVRRTLDFIQNIHDEDKFLEAEKKRNFT